MILTKEDYQNLEEACINYDAEIYEDYSGRGMYGETCFGFYGRLDMSDANDIIATAFESNSDLLKAVCVDDLGRDTIYYFPGYNFNVSDI